MRIYVFSPNGVVTRETCSVCETPGVKVEHGRESILEDGKCHNTGSLQHLETCSLCGESMPIVCYDCQDCGRVE